MSGGDSFSQLKTRHLYRGPQLASPQLAGNFPPEVAMLYYALVFLVIALVAGALGFGFVAFAAAGVAKVLFMVFLVLFVVSLVVHLSRGGTAV